jgi:hypothetical protein
LADTTPDALSRYLATAPKPTFGTGTNPTSADLPSGSYYEGTATPGQTFDTPTYSGGTPNTTDSTGVDPSTLANDWYKAYFGSYGLPQDVQDALIGLLTKYAADPSTAMALSTQYLRSTPWFQTTFPGFSSGVQNGMFTDETGYRNYMNTINSIYNQYMGRHVSGDEINALLKEGAAPQLVANRFQGQAWVQANTAETQYLGGAFGQGRLSSDQLTALGNENSGIDTAQGQIQQKILAQAQRIQQKIFTGTLATPSLSLGTNGLTAPSLAGNQQTPNVAA